MFDDEYSNFNEDSDESNGFEMYRKQVESEFFKTLESGKSIVNYLYLPHFFISDRVKEQLDIFLLKEAYKNMFEPFGNENTVYQDAYITIVITDNKFKIDTLKQMIDYFTSTEEYEKCSKIKAALEKCEENEQKVNDSETAGIL